MIWERNVYESNQKKKTKVIIVLTVILLAIIIGVVSCSKLLTAVIIETPLGITELSTAEKRDILDYISVSGSVESENMIKITSTLNAKVKIILAEKKDVLSVPYESIVQNDDGSSYVLLAVTDETSGVTTAKAAKVEPGMSGTYYTEISSDEVKEGDKVVMNGTSCVDGDELTVMPGQVKSGK